MSADQVGRFRRGCSRNGQLNSSPSHSQLQFQDSALSPTLALLPANRAGEASVAEYSFFQKSDAEFLPLSASLDFSAGHESDEGSLSQHPLAQEVDASSVSCGPRSTRPDGASELLYRQLLARTNKSAPATSSGQKCVPASASRGAEEASFLGFLPQSQSTPGLREPPSESAVVPSSDHESKKVRDGNALPDSNASLLAESSVITSDVDNDAPRWTSKDQRADLNIEERIPLYLQNLGIDRSPADILTPFGPRGPIREPEFSPTDLSTVKDSVGGTPAKLSEDGSPPKGDLADSGASFPSGQESLPGAARGRSATSSASSADAGRPPALPNSRSADVSSPRARSSLFAVQSLSGSATGAGGSARLVATNSSPELSVEIQDTASPRRVEPEGCSAAPRSPIAVGPPPEPAPDEEVSLPDGTAPIREDPEDRSAMSDGSGQSSLTVRVAELLRGGSPASGLSDRDDPEHKRRFILKLSEGRFDSLELGEEDRRRIEEIKAAMLSNNFVTSESSTDTESTAMAAAAQPVSDPGGARTPVLPGPERTHPEDREFAGGADVKAHTTRMRPASASSLTPDPLPPTQLDAGFVHKKTSSSSSSSEGAGGSESAAEADSAAGPGRTHVAEDTTIPFAQVSRAHLGLSPKPPEGGPRPPTSSSSSSSSRSRPTAEFVPLRRSSPAPGVGRSGPPPRWDGRRGLASALAPPPPPPHPHHSVAGGSMRSSTPETPVRDECAPRAAPLRPYKPRGAGELFFVPHAEADASSSCTTMESSHTGLDDAVPPPFPAEVLGRTDPGLDRGVFIKHAEGIYSKKRANAHSGGAVTADGRLPPAAAERLVPGGGVARPPSDREAWLLEQLHRLSELVLATGGAAEPPTSRGQTQGSLLLDFNFLRLRCCDAAVVRRRRRVRPLSRRQRRVERHVVHAGHGPPGAGVRRPPCPERQDARVQKRRPTAQTLRRSGQAEGAVGGAELPPGAAVGLRRHRAVRRDRLVVVVAAVVGHAAVAQKRRASAQQRPSSS
ncbi:uncharacterized protein alms1 isoform X2 [Syngnathoides biaculeatus]|uniref:uncharacterized protein alms1 isoform X2 n=1 Tax=Syngnathoides biaculeatus TaxID=300417 RepID=UPI002ADE9161|nr:uncharacterized protein alms1 isoform X2 [Syngnathoides biaculeatus]